MFQRILFYSILYNAAYYDSALCYGKIGEFVINAENVIVEDVGFHASVIIGYEKTGSGELCSNGIPINGAILYSHSSGTGASEKQNDCNFTITDNGFFFTIKSYRMNYYNNTEWYYIALK